MPDADPGYLTDVEYTGNFFAHLAPAWLGYIAAINGYAAPRIDREFTWCELGCGKGLTPLVLAATHPGGRFYGCDLNPTHIEYAQALQRAAGLTNVQLYAKSFGDMLREDLPAFDFIVLHGVYSWIPPAARAEVHEFIRRKLRPGGLVMLSYNAMPGWAHLLPIREMMRAYAQAVPGDSLAKARASFASVDRLAREGALYFRVLPAAAQHLQQLAQQDIRYVAHEYLTPHCEPFYFSQVHEALRGLGLAYAGAMAPKDNYRELMLPQQLQSLAAGASTRAELETQRDFIVNTTFRQDLYAAQASTEHAAAATLAAFEAFDFCLLAPPAQLPLKQAHQQDQPLAFDLEPDTPAVRALHAALAAGPASARALHTRTGLAADTLAALLQKLVIAGHVVPCPPARTGAGWPGINAAVIETGIREQQAQVPLASPYTGAASYSELVYALAIEAAVRCGDADTAARRVLQRLRAHGHPVNRLDRNGARRPATDAEVQAYVALTWRELRAHDAAHPGSLQIMGWSS